jgi:beta-lactamase class A
MPAGALDSDAARNAIAAVAKGCSGHVGLAARHLGTGEELTWNPDAAIQTASTVKVAIYAEVMRQSGQGLVDLDARVTTRPADLTRSYGQFGRRFWALPGVLPDWLGFVLATSR